MDFNKIKEEMENNKRVYERDLVKFARDFYNNKCFNKICFCTGACYNNKDSDIINLLEEFEKDKEEFKKWREMDKGNFVIIKNSSDSCKLYVKEVDGAKTTLTTDKNSAKVFDRRYKAFYFRDRHFDYGDYKVIKL